LVLISPGSAKTYDGVGGIPHNDVMSQLSQEYFYQKLLKSDNPSSSYNRKCSGLFKDRVYKATENMQIIDMTQELNLVRWILTMDNFSE